MPKAYIRGGSYCSGDFHVYPNTFAGNPEYAKEYFSRCVCGKKKKVTTTIEVDAAPSKPRKEG